MELLLPKKINSTEKMVLTDARQVTVIGANGSGKTRFCNQMMKLCGDKAFRLCAMRAMFPLPTPSSTNWYTSCSPRNFTT